MSNPIKNDSTTHPFLLSLFRGVATNGLIAPFQIIQKHQEYTKRTFLPAIKHTWKNGTLTNKKIYAIKFGGNMFKAPLRGAVSLPIVLNYKSFLSKEHIYIDLNNFQKFTLSCTLVSALEAGWFSPLDRIYTHSITDPKFKLERKNISHLLHKGGKGSNALFLKQFFTWFPALGTQIYLRNYIKKTTHKNYLTPQETITVGVVSAILLTLIKTPFDVMNTLKQSQNKTYQNQAYFQLLQKISPKSCVRLFPVHFITHAIRSLTTLWLAGLILDKKPRT